MKIKSKAILICVLMTTIMVGCRPGSAWGGYKADQSYNSKQLYEMSKADKKVDQSENDKETMNPWSDGSQSYAEDTTEIENDKAQANVNEHNSKEDVNNEESVTETVLDENNTDGSGEEKKTKKYKVPKIAYIADKSGGLEVLTNYENNKRRRFSFYGLNYEIANYHILQTVEKGKEINIYYVPDAEYNELKPVHVQIIEGVEYIEDEKYVKDYFNQYESCKKIVHYKNVPDKFVKDVYVAESSEYDYYLIKSEKRTLFLQTNYKDFKNVILTADLSDCVTYESSTQEVSNCGMNGEPLLIWSEYNKNENLSATYNLGENRDGKEYTLVVTSEQKDYYTYTNNLQVIYSDGIIQQFSWDSVDVFTPIFRDINLDGYTDLLISTASGVDTNIYNLYTWDSKGWKYEKVECAELVSSKIDVQSGRIINWVKAGDGYNMVIYEWVGNSLVKIGEEYRISMN